jgi:hypothetical protein
MQDFKEMWEDWYGDLVSMHQWHELEYNGREIAYVHGVARYTGDEGAFPAAFVQVIGHLEPEAPINEEAQREIAELLKSRHGIDNICFWSV